MTYRTLIVALTFALACACGSDDPEPGPPGDTEGPTIPITGAVDVVFDFDREVVVVVPAGSVDELSTVGLSRFDDLELVDLDGSLVAESGIQFYPVAGSFDLLRRAQLSFVVEDDASIDRAEYSIVAVDDTTGDTTVLYSVVDATTGTVTAEIDGFGTYVLVSGPTATPAVQ